jgi:hypothetical protein
MAFMLELDGDVRCGSAALRDQSLLSEGWRLTDPWQAEDLLESLALEELAERGHVPYPRDLD